MTEQLTRQPEKYPDEPALQLTVEKIVAMIRVNKTLNFTKMRRRVGMFHTLDDQNLLACTIDNRLLLKDIVEAEITLLERINRHINSSDNEVRKVNGVLRTLYWINYKTNTAVRIVQMQTNQLNSRDNCGLDIRQPDIALDGYDNDIKNCRMTLEQLAELNDILDQVVPDTARYSV